MGDITSVDLVALRRRIFDDPAYDADGVELFDFSQATLGTVSIDEVKAGATRFRTERYAARRAFVASDPATFGTLRMYLTLREVAGGTSETGVFNTVADAERWLGID